MKKLSIVIPVYNTEKWVARCLNSCVQQDIPSSDYEIIVVNDGTPDNAMTVINSYASQYDNIRIVEQDNGGLSAARNTGMSIAQGEYVWFVDSDDFIATLCIGELLQKAESDNLDVLCFGLNLIFDDGKSEPYRISYECAGKVYVGNEFVCAVDMPPAAWSAMYKRAYLDAAQLRFMVGIVHEDLEFTPRAYCMAQRIAYVDSFVYNYYQREGSLMKSSNQRRAADLLCVSDSLYAFLLEHTLANTPERMVMLHKVAFAFSQSLAFCNACNRSVIDAYMHKPYYPLLVSTTLPWRERLKYGLINYSVRLYLIIYKIIKHL